jgi:hypothetical protein
MTHPRGRSCYRKENDGNAEPLRCFVLFAVVYGPLTVALLSLCGVALTLTAEKA